MKGCGILNKKIDFQLSKTSLNIVTIYILQYALIIYIKYRFGNRGSTYRDVFKPYPYLII